MAPAERQRRFGMLCGYRRSPERPEHERSDRLNAATAAFVEQQPNNPEPSVRHRCPARRESPSLAATSRLATESGRSLPWVVGVKARQMLTVLLDELLSGAQLDQWWTAALSALGAQREAHRGPEDGDGNHPQFVASHGTAFAAKTAGTPLGHVLVRHHPSHRPLDVGVTTLARPRRRLPRERAYANRGHLCPCVSMCVDTTRPSVPDGSDRVS
jgi:hypothetical protein